MRSHYTLEILCTVVAIQKSRKMAENYGYMAKVLIQKAFLFRSARGHSITSDLKFQNQAGNLNLNLCKNLCKNKRLFAA